MIRAREHDLEARSPTRSELATLCSIVEARTGLTISEAKQTLVGVRLAPRLRDLKLDSLDAYCRLLERSDAELTHIVDLITTHETSFFRQPHHFAFLENQLVPKWRDDAHRGKRPHEVRVWSAACSTGEEPYSIAMALRSGLPARGGWSVHVLATDISEAALGRARAGIFSEERARRVPDPYRKAYLRAGARSQPSMVKADPEITAILRFQRINLLDGVYPVARDYDLIFCRNVLIYMRPEAQKRVVQRLFGNLAKGGHLFLGQAEGLLGMPGVKRVAPTIYQASPGAVSVASERPPAIARDGGRR